MANVPGCDIVISDDVLQLFAFKLKAWKKVCTSYGVNSIMLSFKEGCIKYHFFLSLWYDSIWD